ncbi:MAG: LPS export ABC transporter periplasmic protein LptC [Gemmatimonadota bacterium]
MTMLTKVLGSLIFLLVMVACEEEADIATISSEVVALDADFIVFGGEQYITQGGKTEAHVQYDTAFQWMDSTAVALRQLRLTVFHEDGSERAHVTSRSGTLDQLTNQMVARGNVVMVVPGDGITLRTEELHYDPQAGQIWSDTVWTMQRPDRMLSGTSFTSDLEFRNFQARGQR